VQLINDWFDLINSQHKYDNGIVSYGLNKSSLNDLLDRMNNFINNMRVHAKTSLLPFQKGKLPPIIMHKIEKIQFKN